MVLIHNGRRVIPVAGYHRVVVSGHPLVYLHVDEVDERLVAYAAVDRDRYIEDQSRVSRAADHAEIVHGHGAADLGGYIRDHLNELFVNAVLLRVICHDGVEMYHDVDAGLLEKIVLYPVDQVVADDYVLFRGDLGVDGREASVGTVVVDHEIMITENAVVAHDPVPDLLHELRRRSLAEERVRSLDDEIYAGPDDEPGDGAAEPPVEVDAGEL